MEMMSNNNNKNNLNKAMFDMFGVGKAPEQEKKEIAPVKEQAAVVKTEAPAAVKVAPPAVKVAPPAKATYIAEGIVIEGNITAKGDIEMAGELKGNLVSGGAATIHSSVMGHVTASAITLIDCCVTGDLSASGDIVVTENSVVNGNIKGNSLSCSGKVNGDVAVKENVSLDSSARVIGNITTGSMIVARGAIIKGTIEMRADG